MDQKENLRLEQETEQCWRCDLCQISVTCEKNLKDQMVGNKHKKKLANVNAFSGSVAYASNVHEQKVPSIKVDEKINKLTPMGIGSGSGEDKSAVQAPKVMTIRFNGQNPQVVQVETYLWCQLCNTICSSKEIMYIHLSGEMHRAKVAESSNCTKLENTMVPIFEESKGMQPAEAAAKYGADAEGNVGIQGGQGGN